MKLTQPIHSRSAREGSATIIFLILLSIMLILVTAEMRSLSQLHNETSLLEQQQIKHLDQSLAKPASAPPAQSKTSRQP